MAKKRSKKIDNQDIRQQLIDAITAGDVNLVRDLIAKGAYSATDKNIDIALKKTNKRKHKAIKAISELLKNAYTDLADQFMEAAKAGKTKAVRDLIARGADLRSTNKKGATAWELAATAGHDAVVKVLMDESEPEYLLAHPESGHPPRVPCPICGEFYDIDDGDGAWRSPKCGHLLGTIYDDGGAYEQEYEQEYEQDNAVNMFDDIVLDVVRDVGYHIRMEKKRFQKGLGKYQHKPGQSFEKEFLNSVPKNIATAIESMMQYGKQWWTFSSGVKEGISTEVIETLNVCHYRSFFHKNVELCTRKHKDTGLKVLKWLEKQIGGPNVKLLLVTYPAEGKKGGECFKYCVTEREARRWISDESPRDLHMDFDEDFIEVAIPVTAQGLAEYLNTQPYL